MEDRRFYVYVHLRATSKEPFYYGKGCGRRAWHHYEKGGRTDWWQKVARKHGVEVRILHLGLTAEEAIRLEIKEIKEAKERGENIVNMTEGGDTVDRVLASKWGKKGAALVWVKEGHREKMRTLHRALAATPARKEQLRYATEKSNGPEQCAKRAIFHKELGKTALRKGQLQKAWLAAHTPEASAKRKESMKKYAKSEKGIDKIKAFQKVGSSSHFEKLKNDVEYREKYTSALRAGWVKRKQKQGELK